MAEAFISLIVQQLGSIIGQQVEQKVKLVVDVKKEVAKLTSNFIAIEAVLQNAEERQVKEADVRYWLDNLKEVSYEMDDVLDEWNTEILKLRIQREEKEAGHAHVAKKKQVCFCIPAHWVYFGQVSSQVILRYDIGHKIEELNERLSLIASERQNYNFQYTTRGSEQLERPKSTSFVDTTFGRVVEKEILVSKLLSESSQGSTAPLVIPIVGMGGIGKTTLAQLAYNDEKVKAQFDNRIWVCVSDPFDEIKIAKEIIEGFNKNDSTLNSNKFKSLLKCIDEYIKGKKFLLVLDDVWTQDSRKWEQLKLPLQSGAIGSRIVVTTRKEEVARMMGAATHIIRLTELSDQNCRSLFYHIAFGDRVGDESKVFEDIGEELVKKCKGMPLVAKTLGGLMRYKRTRREWLDVLNSKIWELDVVQEQVFQSLLLSYYDLVPTVKRCLLYCVIFPKDYVIDKDNLIELWMSQNFLNSNGNKEKEIVGQMYFDNLSMRSFFQDFVEDEFLGIKRWKMHDIVHDFLQFLTKNECLSMEFKGGYESMELAGDKVRHFSLMFAPEGPLAVSFQNCKSLRTLATFNSKITSFGPELFLQLKCLRTLNLSDNSIQEVPEEVGELVQLRYLDLSNNTGLKKLPDTLCNLFNLQTLRLIHCRELETLPDSVCNLFNLQTLRLMECRGLKTLPEAMGKLINLKHLHVAGSYGLKLPKGIGRLTSLRTLDRLEIDGDEDKEAFNLSDLRNMDQLQGSLSLNLWNVKDASDAEKAQLVNKKHLLSLELWFCSVEEQMGINEKILNALQPNPNLECLFIWEYEGTTLSPNWMMSLNNLTRLWIRGGSCEVVTLLGKLVSLEWLTIEFMYNVRKVGFGLSRIELESRASSSSLVLFPNLKQLEFSDMESWKEWEVMAGGQEEDSQITTMPCLSSLEISSCYILQTLPEFLRKTPLQNLSINDCDILAAGCQKGRGKEWPKISHIPNIIIDDTTVQKDGVWIQQDHEARRMIPRIQCHPRRMQIEFS